MGERFGDLAKSSRLKALLQFYGGSQLSSKRARTQQRRAREK